MSRVRLAVCTIAALGTSPGRGRSAVPGVAVVAHAVQHKTVRDSARAARHTTSRPRPSHVSSTAPERIYDSQTSQYDMSEETVLHDRAAWGATWTQLHNGLVAPELPRVDFTTSSLVLVAIGQRASAGSEVRVENIARHPSGAVVQYTVTEPGAGCMSAQMMTSPVTVVRVPRLTGAVQFERRTVRRPC